MALWLRKVHRCNPSDRWSILRLSWKRVTDRPPRNKDFASPWKVTTPDVHQVLSRNCFDISASVIADGRILSKSTGISRTTSHQLIPSSLLSNPRRLGGVAARSAD